ncbi:MAG: hypothetical protein ACKPAH_09220, partial [Verrucomicrobiota bacterium]
LQAVSGDEKAALSGDEKTNRSSFSASTGSAEPLFRTVEPLFWAAPFVRTELSKPMSSTLTTSFWRILTVGDPGFSLGPERDQPSGGLRSRDW